MSDDSAEKDGTIIRAERGRFAEGNRGGPGRPKRGETRAEQVRRNVDWEKADARMVAVMLDPKTKPADSIAAYVALNDRGWGKPMSSHELHVNPGDTERRYNVNALSVDETRQLLEKIDAAELPAGEGES